MILAAAIALAADCQPSLPPDTPAEVAASVDAPSADALQAAYIDAGYPAARAHVTEDCTLHVTLGARPRAWFRGAGTLKRITLSDNVLPLDETLTSAQLDAEAARLDRQLDRRVAWRVIDGDVYRRVPGIGRQPMPQVEFVIEDAPVRGIDISIDSQQPYSLITGVGWSTGANSFPFALGVKIGTPYHRWATESQPRVRWTYGGAFIRLGQTRSLQVEVSGELGNWNRLELGILQAFIPIGRIDVDRALLTRGNLLLTVGARVEVAGVFAVDTVDDVPLPMTPTGRFELKGTLGWRGDHPRRADRAPMLDLSMRVGTDHKLRPRFTAILEAQQSTRFGPVWLIARNRTWSKAGAQRFFDAEPIGSKWQRVFYAQRHWANHASLLDLQALLPLGSSFGVFAFTDGSVFQDLGSGDPTWIVSGGPGVSVTLWTFAIEAAYGFGLRDGSDPSRNLSLIFRTVY